jgi:hypothetical protein
VADLGEVFRFLRSRGFTPTKRKGKRHYFVGALTCIQGAVKVSLAIADWDFLSYPTITILEHPAFLPALLPHVSATGYLCYFRSGEVILDRLNPVKALAQCLKQAAEVINLLCEPNYRQKEFEEEFGATWNIGQSSAMPAVVMVGDLDNPSTAKWNCTDKRFLIASSDDEVERICRAAKWPIEVKSAGHCGIVRSESLPSLPSKLPATIGELFQWARDWSPGVYKEIQRQLESPAYLKHSRICFLFRTPNCDFGVDFAADNNLRKGLIKRPKLYRDYLHKRGRNTPIRRLSIVRIGADHVHSRNLTHKTLKDQVVTLVGGGAIGGYLAQALVKLGAGTGTGELFLVDPDTLSSDNLGRHLLGYESLFRSKSDALRDYVTQQFPNSKVTSLVRRLDFDRDLRGQLIINATGEETLSEAINARHLRLPAQKPDVLHVWIAGNGEAAQALWVDKPKYACFRCLRLPDETRRARFELLPESHQTKVIGCSAFTPYAVSAPLLASALAVDMVISWLNGNPSPRFRTRIIENTDARKLKNQDLEPLAGCEACR